MVIDQAASITIWCRVAQYRDKIIPPPIMKIAMMRGAESACAETLPNPNVSMKSAANNCPNKMVETMVNAPSFDTLVRAE